MPDPGRLRATLNPDKQPGDKRPAFFGALTLPDGVTREFKLWPHPMKSGEVMLSGKADPAAREQIRALLSESQPPDLPGTNGDLFALDPHDIMLFESKLPSPEELQQKSSERRADYYGYYCPGGPDSVLMSLRVWAENDRSGKPELRGTVRKLLEHRDVPREFEAPELEPRRKRDRERDR